MLSPRGRIRMEQWERSGGRDGQTPYTNCQRADVPGWESQRLPPPPGSLDALVLRDLHAIDPAFEIIRLPFTAMSPNGPCHHLYRRTSGQGTDGHDVLALQFSLQHDVTRPWADGEPRLPGMWLVSVVKQHDKARRYSSEEAAVKAIKAESDKAYDDAWAASQASQIEFENEVNSMFAPYLKRGRVIPHYLWATPSPKTPKTTILLPDGTPTSAPGSNN